MARAESIPQRQPWRTGKILQFPDRRNSLEKLRDAVREHKLRSALIAIDAIAGAGEAGYVATHQDVLDAFRAPRAAASDTLPDNSQIGKDLAEYTGAPIEIVLSPATETPTSVATSTATPEAPASPTTAPTKVKVVERPTEYNAKTRDLLVTEVPQTEYQQLMQQEGFAFPADSKNPDFEVKYEERSPTSESSQGNEKRLFISGSNVKLIAPVDGEVYFRRNDRSAPDKITAISISQKLPDGTTLYVSVMISLDNPATKIDANIDDGEVKKGALLAKINGKVFLGVYVADQLKTPIVFKKPDGIIVEIYSLITDIVPPLFPNMDAANDWIRDLATGKIAISNGS